MNVRRWDTNNLARSRAKRAGSSAPTSRELRVYKKYLLRAIRGKRHPRVLVLGATPELRDLAIGKGCETLAVDMSEQVILAMESCMRYRDNPRNLIMKCDWIGMNTFLSEKYFDAVVADCSLNNVPIHLQSRVCSNVAKLLKPGGLFITRNIVDIPQLYPKDIAYFQRLYNARKISWLFFWLILGSYTSWREKVVHVARREVIIANLCKLCTVAIRNGDVQFRKEDLRKIENIQTHGKTITHFTFMRDEFEKLLAKYFRIVAREDVPHCEPFPIYALRKK